MEEKETQPLKLIFLDVDGVLNSEKHYIKLHKQGKPTIDHNMELQPSALKYLKRLCKKTGAQIILSSTWRMSEEACQNLSNQLSPYIIVAKTPMYSACRGEEILKFLSDLTSTTKPKTEDRYTNIPCVSHICIIDDDSDMGMLTPQLVKTSFKKGFGRKEYKQALKLLTTPYPKPYPYFPWLLFSAVCFWIASLCQFISILTKASIIRLLISILYLVAGIVNFYTYKKHKKAGIF